MVTETYTPRPPFEIYDQHGLDISDAEGHLCTADDPLIAKALLGTLNSVWPEKIDWRELETFITDTMRDNRDDSWAHRIEVLSKKLADKLNGKNDRGQQSGGCAAQARPASDEDAHQHTGRKPVVHRAGRSGVGGNR